jgi:hypothetical protein
MRYLLLLCLLALLISSTLAQDTETWPIIERCVPEPIPSPDDWSFEGIIFLQQYFVGNDTKTPLGIYGLANAKQAPYLISPALVTTGTGSFINSGSLSPDGRWFAVPSGRVKRAALIDNTYEVDTIHVYSTDNTSAAYTVQWNGWYRGSDISVVPFIQWHSLETFLYNELSDSTVYEINPFTGTHFPYDEEYSVHFPLSPITEGRTTHRYQNQDRQGIIYFEDNSLKLDSTTLLKKSYDPQDSGYRQSVYWMVDWTQNLAYFYIVVQNQLYIGTIEERILYNICLDVDSAAWSPNGELAISDGERISIINFEDNTHYIAGYHQGSVFDWRVPPKKD